MTDFETVVALASNAALGGAREIPGPVDWDGALRCATQHGLAAVCYGELQKLPADRKPGFDCLVRWDVAYRQATLEFEVRSRAKEHLREVFAENGIRMLLLKGETLARHYPLPETRYSTDVDFIPLPAEGGVRWPEDKPRLAEIYARSNSVVESMGIAVNYENSKHTVYEYEGVEFENHDPVPHDDYNRCDHKTEIFTASSYRAAVERPDGCLELPPTMAAVYIVNHSALHLYMNEAVTMKMLLDLTLLIRHNPSILDEWGTMLKEARLRRFASAMVASCRLLFDGPEGPEGSERSRAEKFVRHFVQCDGSKLGRYLAKYLYIPRRPHEMIREVSQKLLRVIGHRLPSNEEGD